ncbi:bacteriohemerythrin [Thioalkalivibrio sp. XN279]|uniref:bacteriohemerythrin n=1 Tax=Thioalkalivibrio sp. XN279 TaxID=2714953 RepID=UPI00140828DE|nr:hemerythrin family protein [Thioalkalivibrio sp. XN279]NHA15328.1 hemerythrin family protein [Thioalkalivibrio sp. XN279]
MPVVWRERMRIGHELIDADHRYLLSLFNSVELSLRVPDTLRYLPVFFGQFLDYAREHFAREEQVQFKMGFPGYLEHKLEHQRIAAKLAELQDRISTELDAMPEDEEAVAALQEQLRPEILELARTWVIDHILQTDGKMRPWFTPDPAAIRPD